MSDALAFKEFGAGVPVLGLHGWLADHRLLTGCLEPVFAARSGYRRLYPDLPGMGGSPCGSVRDSAGMVAAVSAFVDARLGSARFLLIGQSYGGYLARELVRQRPDQVLGMALLCPMGTELEPARRTVPPRAVLRRDPALVAALEPAFTDVAVVQSAATLARFRAEVASGQAIADRAALASVRENWALAVPPETGAPYERPVLVLTGRQDSSTGYAEQYALLGHYPRASYAVLDRAGHNLQFEQAVLFETLVDEWLDRVEEERERACRSSPSRCSPAAHRSRRPRSRNA
ncbi:alpha/beta fold hydrolase [Amycolatopsis sp. CA-230715]|uniref:alpha/beta fold hydrolase n=1 Tax=Amycolatopsis sp. CA-230715 TaxID=2745196 RepID=UPI001C34247C|nr:alpha/beta hydrolase [Amycolatopsis sp. CA-230715]QWF81726.1 2-succinyl-6-hydroxy-2,4-cyclohexadiene-1-carboxylate synthase [Amycolatopsis sp. CA-230715]